MGKKLTTEQFIEKSKLVHGDSYNYDLVDYTGAENKVNIFCKKHSEVFLQRAYYHIQGSGCPKCGNESTANGISLSNEQFLTRAISIHSDKYDYGEVNYINNRTKIKILCKQCNVYFFQKPYSHLAGCGCTECGIKLAGDKRRKTTEQFIQEANEIHSNRYDYSKTNYTGNTTDIEILCEKHGIFKQIPTVHLSGGGCPKCGNCAKSKNMTKTQEQFILEAKRKHGNKYDYSLIEYLGSHIKIEILCPFHKVYTQIPADHIRGAGCPICGNETHWKREDYIKKAKGRVCIFYTIRCFNEDEEFYKIGITMRRVKERYSPVKHMPYNFEIIKEVKGGAEFIWNLELEEKRKLKCLHYIPKIYFGGSKTECFTDYKI